MKNTPSCWDSPPPGGDPSFRGSKLFQKNKPSHKNRVDTHSRLDTRAVCGSRGSGLLGRAVCAHQWGHRALSTMALGRVSNAGTWPSLTPAARRGRRAPSWRPARALDKHLLAPPLEAGVSPRVAAHRFRRHSWRPVAACAGQAPAGVDDERPLAARAIAQPCCRPLGYFWSARAHPRSTLAG